MDELEKKITTTKKQTKTNGGQIKMLLFEIENKTICLVVNTDENERRKKNK